MDRAHRLPHELRQPLYTGPELLVMSLEHLADL